MSSPDNFEPSTSGNVRFLDEIIKQHFGRDKITGFVKNCKKITSDNYEGATGTRPPDDMKYDLVITRFEGEITCAKKVELKHLTDGRDICLFVEFVDPSIEQLVRDHIGTQNIELMSLQQLIDSSARSVSILAICKKLLADDRIANTVNCILGNDLKRGSWAIPVNLNLVTEIASARRNVWSLPKETLLQTIEVGNQSMRDDDIADNIIDLVEKMDDTHIGGIKNVGKLLLKSRPNYIFMDSSLTSEDGQAVLLFEQHAEEKLCSFSWWKKRPACCSTKMPLNFHDPRQFNGQPVCACKL